MEVGSFWMKLLLISIWVLWKEVIFGPGHPVGVQNSLLWEMLTPRVMEIDNYQWLDEKL